MQNPHLLPEHSRDDDADRTNVPAVASTSRETREMVTRQPRPKPSQQRPMLMRRWLQKLADDGVIQGLEWIDKDRKNLLRIPWCHGSRSEWNEDRSALYRAWAEHKGL